MKSFSFLLASLLLLMLSVSAGCKKTTYQDNVAITGYDTRTGNSCYGGLFMNFYNTPNAPISESYVVKNTPSSIGIDSSTHFPVYLQINWNYVDQAACPQDVTITAYAPQ